MMSQTTAWAVGSIASGAFICWGLMAAEWAVEKVTGRKVVW